MASQSVVERQPRVRDVKEFERDLTVLNAFRSCCRPLMASDDNAERVLGHNTSSNPQRDLAVPAWAPVPNGHDCRDVSGKWT
jgi:hypothetical protein